MPATDPVAGFMPRVLCVAALACGTGVGCSDPVNPYDGYLARPADSATVGEAESASSAESTSASSMGGASAASASGPSNAATTSDTDGSSAEQPDGDSGVTSGAAQGTTTSTASATSSATMAATTSGLGTMGSTSSAGGASTVTSTYSTSDTSGTTGSVAPTTPATFSQIESYLTGYCATSTACHGPGAREVVLTGAATFDTLMTLAVSRCTNQTMVVPGDPSTSAFYNVLTGGCGNFRMPPSCPSDHCTGEENIAMIESWILAGAPQD